MGLSQCPWEQPNTSEVWLQQTQARLRNGYWGDQSILLPIGGNLRGLLWTSMFYPMIANKKCYNIYPGEALEKSNTMKAKGSFSAVLSKECSPGVGGERYLQFAHPCANLESASC